MDALKIKYEDSVIILVVKPAGVAAESRRIGEKDMVSMVRNYRAGKGGDSYIGMIHRLDQPVGGLLLFAKTKEAAAALGRQIQEGVMEKYYQALLCGRIETEGGFTDYLLKERKGNISRVVEKGTPQAKRASLKFRRLNVFSEGMEEETGKGSLSENTGRLESGAAISHVEIKLETGRHHQIRVQMAHHGFPILGDRKYALISKRPEGSGSSGRRGAHLDTGRPLGYNHLDVWDPEEQRGRRQALALFAWKLKFRHPKTGEWMEFREEPEFLDNWKELLLKNADGRIC